MTEESFRTSILPLKHQVYAYALSMVFEVESAKDIVQEVFEKLWKSRTKLGEIQNIEAWAIRITRNHILDNIKKRKLHTINLDEIDVGLPTRHPGELLEEKDLLYAIQLIMKDLPDIQREIFQLRELQGFDNYEIQEILGLNESQVKVYLFRARKKIKECLMKKINYGLEA